MDPTLGEPLPATTADSSQPLPSLPTRLLWVFVSPGKLADGLAETPRWAGALLASAVLIGLSMALIPIDVFMEAQRQAALERGAEFTDLPEGAVNAMRLFFPAIAMVTTALFSFVFAGVYTFVFAFILGDEGRFKQYLAVLTHSWFIAALFGLLLTPLKIQAGDPRFTLNLASFFFFLPEGYLLNVLRALDISQIWSTLVFAQGAHAIDRRRSFGSAAAIGLGILFAMALVAANFF